MVSIIKVTSVQDTSGNNETTTANIKKAYDGSAKAWVYQQNGHTLIASFNISSTTDNSIGNYSHDLTSAMASADVHISIPICRTSDDRSASVIINSASKFTSYSRDISGAGAIEDSYIIATTHGDLA